MSRRPRAIAAAIALAVSFSAPAPVAAREIAIERFDVQVLVHPDASIDVREIIRFRFTGTWNGVIRDIPVDYRTPQGFAFHLDLDDVRITDDDGNALKVESKRVRHYREFKIWVPGATDASRDVVIAYRVPNALRFFENHDELYWNVTGDEWEMPIERASARVVLPEGASGLRATAFTGAYGSRARDADVTFEGREARFEVQKPLGFREGITAVVGWDKGIVRRPPVTDAVWRFLRANLILLVPVLAFFGMFTAWRRWGRDPASMPVTVQYDPPEQLSPAECGTLLDHKLDSRDVTATIVDLAVRGYLTITEVDKSVLLFSTRDYVFEMKKPQSEWSALKDHEQRALGGLFKHGGRQKVELSDLKQEFYLTIPSMREAVYESLQQHGYYRGRPDHASKGWMVLGFGIMVTSFHVAGFSAALLGAPFLTLLIAQLLTGLIVLGFGSVMPARTESGARAAERIRGFEEFLGRVESDHFERVVKSPELFERFLPFAMAFGVEERWAKAFAGILTEPPGWYHGSPGSSFNTMRFGHTMGDFSQRASSSLSSSPRSSGGGSGFGGGGSSGGGGGGGGGRGF